MEERKKKKKMIYWLLLFLFVVVVIVIIVSAILGTRAWATTGSDVTVFHWSKEGTSPFWKTPLRSEQDLKALFQNNTFKAKLAKRLQKREPDWNGAEVVKLAEKAVRSGQYERVAIEPGTEEAEFDWMIAGENWQTEDDAIVRWDGDHPLTAYRVPINYRGEDIDLYFGNHCVNVLKKRKKAEVPPGEYGVKPVPPRAEALPPRYLESAPPVTNYYSYNYYQQPALPPTDYGYYPPSPSSYYYSPPSVYNYYSSPNYWGGMNFGFLMDGYPGYFNYGYPYYGGYHGYRRGYYGGYRDYGYSRGGYYGGYHGGYGRGHTGYRGGFSYQRRGHDGFQRHYSAPRVYQRQSCTPRVQAPRVQRPSVRAPGLTTR